MGFSTTTTKTTFYKKKYIKDNNRDIRVYKENFKLFGTIVVVVWFCNGFYRRLTAGKDNNYENHDTG